MTGVACGFDPGGVPNGPLPSCLRGSLKGSVVGDGVFPKGACDAGVPGTFVANELEFFLFKSEPGIDGTGLDKMPFGVVAVSLTGRVRLLNDSMLVGAEVFAVLGGFCEFVRLG